MQHFNVNICLEDMYAPALSLCHFSIFCCLFNNVHILFILSERTCAYCAVSALYIHMSTFEGIIFLLNISLLRFCRHGFIYHIFYSNNTNCRIKSIFKFNKILNNPFHRLTHLLWRRPPNHELEMCMDGY